MKRRMFTTFELILLALFSALVVVAKIALRLPLQLPGHSGLFWMAIVIVAAGVVPKRGAASLVGLTSGILAAFLGMGDFGALNTLLSYTMVGVGADLALWLLQALVTRRRLVWNGALVLMAAFLLWSTVTLFWASDLGAAKHFYFAHSYHAQISDAQAQVARTDYGFALAASVQKDNVYGVQFHPEKSGKQGLKVLQNFYDICGRKA